MTNVSIIIPAWNLWNTTLQCLESLAKTCAQSIVTQSIEVIVVDNGSTDETQKALDVTLTRLFGECGKALRMPQNLGFAKACNLGAQLAQSPLLFFLNNDTILTENWLPPLVQALENNPKLGMVGPLLLYPDNSVQHCGICITPTSEFEHLYHTFPSTHPAVNKARLLQAITAAAVLIPKQLFFECEGFYEGFVNGFEDIDLCCAVREKGLYCACIPQSRIYHLESLTPGRFDNDAINASLLQERRKNLALDFHSFAVEDGFIPTLSPALKFYISMQEAKEKALSIAFAQNFDAQSCLAKLEIEPLWFGGYVLMANHYHASNQNNEALQILIKLTNLAPLPAYLKMLQTLATQMEHGDITKQAQYIEQSIASEITKQSSLQQKAEAMLQRAIATQDEVLKTMVEQWSEHNKTL